MLSFHHQSLENPSNKPAIATNDNSACQSLYYAGAEEIRLSLLCLSLALPLGILVFVKVERWHSHQLSKEIGGRRRCLAVRKWIFSRDVILPVYDYVLWLSVVSALIRASLDAMSSYITDVNWNSNKWWFWLLWGFGLQGSREFSGSVVAFLLIQRSSGVAAFKRAALGAFMMLLLAGFIAGILTFEFTNSSMKLFLSLDTLTTAVYVGIMGYMCTRRRRRWKALYVYILFQISVNMLYLLGSASMISKDDPFRDQLCLWTTGDLLIILAQPIAILFALKDDSRYWRSLATVVGAAGTRGNADVFDNAIQTISRRSFSELSEFLAMEIKLLDFARLEILEGLGSGASASVYRASYGSEELALKSLDFQELTADVVRSYCQEAILSFRLNHRNVVHFVGVCLRPPELFLAFEFCRRGSLRALLDSPTSLPIATRVQLALDVAEGMTFLHRRRIVHRDLKAANVLVQEDENGNLVAKVADFGLSRIILSRPPPKNRGGKISTATTPKKKKSNKRDPSKMANESKDTSFSNALSSEANGPYGERNQRTNTLLVPGAQGSVITHRDSSVDPNPHMNHEDSAQQWSFVTSASFSQKTPEQVDKKGGINSQTRSSRDPSSFSEQKQKAQFQGLLNPVANSNPSTRVKNPMTTAVGTIEYMAPELLEEIQLPVLENNFQELKIDTKTATSLYGYEVDVYAFAIVLWEIATRRYPYAAVRRTRDIQQMVLAGLRLRLPAGCRLPVRYARLMNNCWQEDPTKRPGFEDIATRLQDIWFHDCEAYDEEDGTATRSTIGEDPSGNKGGPQSIMIREPPVRVTRSSKLAEDLIRDSWSGGDSITQKLLSEADRKHNGLPSRYSNGKASQ